MTDYEYILQQAKKFHFTGWNDEELRKCVDMLPNLTRQELITLTLNKTGVDNPYFEQMDKGG